MANAKVLAHLIEGWAELGRGVGVESDPRYVAATIARWEAFTGAAAVPLEPREATDG